MRIPISFKNLLDKPIGALFLLSLLSALIYSNTFYSSFHFDDIPQIVDNQKIKNISNFYDFSGTRYIGYLSFALNYKFGGLNVFGYHLVNLLIHIANGFLVYILISLLFKNLQDAFASAPSIAFSSAIIFISHPIQTQSITYIVQRFTSLTAMFYLLAIVCYLKWRLSLLESTRRYLWYAGALLAVVFAMKTKEISFTLPFMILLIELIFFKHFTKQRWVSLIPFLLTLMIIPMSRLDAGVGENESSIIPIRDVIFEHRLYLPTIGWSIVVSSSLLYVMKWLQKGERLDINLLYYLVISVVVLCLSITAHRRNYIWKDEIALWSDVSSKSPRKARARYNLGFSYFNNGNLEKAIEEFQSALKINPYYIDASYSLGNVYLQKGQIEKAAIEYRNTIRLNPMHVEARNNLGVIYLQQGQIDKALEEFKALLIFGNNTPSVHNNIGEAYRLQGRFEDAIRELQIALMLDPNYANAYNSMGLIYKQLEHLNEAIYEFQTALKIKPDLAHAYYNLGDTYLLMGQVNNAINAFEHALKFKPDFSAARKALESLSR